LNRYLSWISEAIVIFAVLLVVNNYLENQSRVINADGKGYYDYLPATFIYHDLNFNYTDTLQTSLYVNGYSNGYLKTVNGKQINKYFPGVSILWTPFFLGAHYYALNHDIIADGYSWPYQRSIFYAAIFYLWIGLVFTRKVLTLLGINSWVILLIQITLTLGTPLIHYTQFEPAFTHVYSFTLIAAFTYFSFKYIKETKLKHILIAGLILGLITIVRPVNLMAALVILLYFNSLNNLLMFIFRLFTEQLKHLLIAFIPFILVVSIVPLLWHFQTGQFFVWGYQDEGFNFLDPEFFNFLFSFKRGAFLHTPLLLIASIGGAYSWIKTRKIYNAFSFLFVLTLITYVLSSWWSWYYGASFGSRPTIDFYIIFAIGLAQFINELKPKLFQIGVSLCLLIFIPINLIQAYQYQNYIFDWGDMTYYKFKTIGLHTEDKYKGIFFVEEFSYPEEQAIFTYNFTPDTPIILAAENTHWFPDFQLDSTVNISQVNYVHIQADIEYTDATANVIISINNSNKENIYWHGKNIFSATKTENTREICNYYYKVPPQNLENFFKLVISSNSDNIIIHSVKLTMLNH
jgi:hypothetical protein